VAEDRAVLIVAPAWVGDMVMAQCLFRALKAREPDTTIDVVAPPATAALARRMPEIRDAIELPVGHGGFQLATRWRIGRSLRYRYEQAYVLPGSFKSALVPWFARARRRTGYLGEQRYGLINDVRERSGERRRTAETFQALAGPGPLLMPQLTVDAANQERLCARWGLLPGGFVAIAPGAEYGPAKRWPAAKYAQLASMSIAGQLLGSDTQIAIFGSAGDLESAREIAAEVPSAIVTCGETGLLDAVDLIGAAGLVVSNDSGLMHVAAAVGRPLVAVYGSTVPDHTPPLSDHAATVSLRLDCAPCFQRTCPLGHTRCLNDLAPERVLDAAMGLLTRGHASAGAQG
jgi:heptosyltransferase II